MPHRQPRLPPILAILLLLVFFSIGCGKPSGPEKFEVFGKVTHNGRPIDDGDIAFHPEPGSPGPPSSGTIKDGTYRLRDSWGLTVGTYQVRINGYRAPPPGESNLIPGAPAGAPAEAQLDRPPETKGVPRREQYLREQFNTQSTIEKLVVAAGQKKIEKNYDLKD